MGSAVEKTREVLEKPHVHDENMQSPTVTHLQNLCKGRLHYVNVASLYGGDFP